MDTLSVTDLKRMTTADRGIAVINVLGRDAYDEAHIPGSINIPLDREDFVDEVARQIPGKDEPVVVYCASETCQASPKAGRRLEEAGYTRVYDFEDGIKGWQDAGQPVEQSH